MKRLWVVECQFDDGSWDICDFTEQRYSSTRFYFAHLLKRNIWVFLTRDDSKLWTKKRFRVREWIRKE